MADSVTCTDTHLGRLVSSAMMGFDVVPFFITHEEHGYCLMSMHKNGATITKPGHWFGVSLPWSFIGRE